MIQRSNTEKPGTAYKVGAGNTAAMVQGDSPAALAGESHPTSGTRRSRPQQLLHHPATAWLVLFLSVMLTGIAWYVSVSFSHKHAQARFNDETEDVQFIIEQRMLAYQASLYGAAALFAASENVSRAEWRFYVDTLQLGLHFPGIQGLGFSQVVTPADRARHEAQIRNEGFPDYRIWPPGEREIYTSIVYLEPFNPRNQRAFGFDMFSEPTRQAAMAQARDSGLPAVSARVMLVQETDTDVQHGFLMYVPVYRNGMPIDTVAQRRNALQGFVYAPFRLRDLMQRILGNDKHTLEFELYDGTQPAVENILYQTESGPVYAAKQSSHTKFSSTRRVDVAGRTWTLYVHAHSEFLSTAEQLQPVLIATGGLMVNMLLFVIISSLSRRQKLAAALAHEMTVDLRRSNADLEQFAYAASHDMRQPLRMVSSYLQLLETDLSPVLTEETRKNLNFAIDGAQRMDQMLTGMLEYSRLGRQVQSKALLDSRALLDEALRALQPAIDEAQANIRIEGQWPAVLASRDGIVRLLQNLIGNAVKYRLEGLRPEIVISASPAAASNGEHRFAISDNGIGLSAEHEGRLFRMFERLQPREKYPGAGIGLALCRKIIEQHGGRIWAESAGDHLGCTFVFTLPNAITATSTDPAVVGQPATRI